MNRLTLSIAFAITLTGCAIVVSDDPPGGPVVVGPPPAPPLASVAAPRALKVPRGHYPPPGHCRVWYPGRPPGHQPPPVRCEHAVAVRGSFILYNGKAWDGDYDWPTHARRHPGSVPHVIVEISVRRR